MTEEKPQIYIMIDPGARSQEWKREFVTLDQNVAKVNGEYERKHYEESSNFPLRIGVNSTRVSLLRIAPHLVMHSRVFFATSLSAKMV